ncbi:hypothetical protein K3172_10005 [Qipengyuania sp. 6B39]|uniref:hypothetical protein n=1 Tax=Qipengyuania proteolytica TaxID=2867239 RepID=UPI001C891F68|nr:hypothetical protein [Qipengyuania proteolytica]MBX7496184.1 hypothetical protein [Qipengyuania proteolytica]
MSTMLIVIAAIAVTFVALLGLARVSMWMTDRKDVAGSNSWFESGQGNPDGYGDFAGGGDGDQ